jgi:hypothetical protein
MRDTTPDADQARLDAIRRMAPIDRLIQALALSDSVRAFALSKLRAAYSDRTDLELVEMLVGAPLLPARPATTSS